MAPSRFRRKASPIGTDRDGYRWRRDRLSLVPPYDRGAAISLTPSAGADLGTLIEIELELRDRHRPVG